MNGGDTDKSYIGAVTKHGAKQKKGRAISPSGAMACFVTHNVTHKMFVFSMIFILEDPMTRSIIALAAALAAAGTASPALAGSCPAGKEGTNALANHPTAPKGVTDAVIGSVDLGSELNFVGHDLRTRRLVVQPGGVVPFHSHAGRPALIVTVKGEITEYRSNCTVPVVHKAGDISREADGISHYWINNSNAPAELLSSDVKAHDK